MPVSSLDPWFPFVRPKPGARLRLFCFPFAGGGASVFRGWAESLPLDVDVWAAQLPGRETRFAEPAYTRMDRLVSDLAAVIRPHLDGPYALLGHSMGALVALELARALRRHGRSPAALIVSGHAPPGPPAKEAPLHALSDEQFRDELRRLNGTPAEVLDHDELMQAVLPTLRADLAVCETYISPEEPPLDCPILALAGRDDARASPADLEAWRTYTRGPFQVRVISGDHFFIQTDRPAVLNAVAGFLGSVRSSDPHRLGQVVWHRPPTVPPLGDNDVHVWQANLDCDEERVRQWSSMLTAEELARAQRFHFRIDRQRWVVGRGVVRRMLGSYLGMRPADVRLWYNSHGKPALTGESDHGGVKFNVSHSGDRLFLAIAKGREIGVDVEHVRPLPEWSELASHYFAAAEIAELDRVPAPERERAFFQCWTRKEAYVKAHGMGMTLPLDGFAVSLAPGQPARLVSTDHDPAQLGRWTLRDVSPCGEYAAAVIIEGSGWNLWCGICPQ